MSSMSTAQSAFPSDPYFPRHIVLMGVSGCGKTSVGAELSRQTGLPYLDGDSLHSFRNVQKMRRGKALCDADRWPWLDRCGKALSEAPQGLILGCSALRRCYRDRLRGSARMQGLLFVHLDGDEQLLQARMAGRRDHYMPLTLLRSQIETLEPPSPDETALRVEIDRPVPSLVRTIITACSKPNPAGAPLTDT